MAAADKGTSDRFPKKLYEHELRRLQVELVKMQRWVRAEGKRVVVIFEGRDAAGRVSVSQKEQEKRFHERQQDPLRSWKLSPMDPESIIHWEEYSQAKDQMMINTDIPSAPWWVVETDDKRKARLNMLAHLLSTLEYHDVAQPAIKLP